jgi:hypothetical protein
MLGLVSALQARKAIEPALGCCANQNRSWTHSHVIA